MSLYLRVEYDSLCVCFCERISGHIEIHGEHVYTTNAVLIFVSSVVVLKYARDVYKDQILICSHNRESAM